MLRDVTSNELFTILIVIGLIFIAIAKLISPRRFDDFMLVLGNSKYLKIYIKDQKFFDRFDAVLFFNLIISSGIFGFIIYRLIYTGITEPSINIMFKLVVAIGAFILIKVLIERLIGSLFEIDKIIDSYLFQKITYKNYLGILLLPINALLLYTITPSLNIIYAIVILLLIVNIVGIITTFKAHQSSLKRNMFYFILYLCALEIAPYIILYKVFNV
ncbi:DUF4271 domain-containing protein [Flavobacteriaceae bacterium XHP0103]|uniref:DUF4271 domain-containing protein n=1 Tax=Marixanthotalea marina TaxID=2844359 RepID=UPI002989C3D2|nr:DUF4271 domain-containing protein [Marixanthotalea marina]MBU3822102.1 DUF4271 domain-containing protein [Marixanthotalea marina]